MKRRAKSTRSARAALAVLLLTTPVGLIAQGLNNLWMGGYASWAGPPYGGVDIDFSSGSLVVSAVSRDIGFFRTNTNITDASGAALFSTNGTFVANALGDTMLNGGGLNPGPYIASYPDGISIPQGALILPKPESPGVYWLLHLTVDDQVGLYAEQLYLTTIDMSLDGGLGGVVSKNQVILTDDLNVGRLTAVRHANGRDWWAFCHKINTDVYYRLLVTPSGISLDGTQSIGVIRNADAGQVCFSPDGSKFAYYWGEPGEDLDLFQFDRCTGLFYDPVYVPITDYDGGIGVAFSPNSRFVYVSSIFDVYQFDTEAADIAASMVHIAEWDSTYSPFPPFATLFDIAQLAPDGKIYISTGNSTDKLHVIHEPDQPGLACNMEQHGISLPRYFSNSLPNHPNYHLGPVLGSVCDSLGMGIMDDEVVRVAARAFPNPSNGTFMLSYPVQPEAGLLEVLDMQGRVVYRSPLAAWSQVQHVELQDVASGMYQCRLRWGALQATTRVILEP
jgi:hypothetical protein